MGLNKPTCLFEHWIIKENLFFIGLTNKLVFFALDYQTNQLAVFVQWTILERLLFLDLTNKQTFLCTDSAFKQTNMQFLCIG